MRYLVLFSCLACLGCDFDVVMTSPSAPAPAGGRTTITNTNTNTNTATTNPDRSDTGPGPGTGAPNEPGAVIPLPAYGEGVTRAVAEDNPALLANSCQETSGLSAWAFLDLVISTLRARDARWGYLCKDASCQTFARDVVAYRASSGNTGIWIVDVIGNHCPGPSDPPPAVRWGVLPFETSRPWAASR